MQIISIVGKKNSGKTSLTMKIIKTLTKRGYTVATIKHSHHSIEMDKKNTDTWKHKKAGSQLVVGIGSTTFINIREILDLERILFLIKIIGNYDFVVIEGFKGHDYPKIATTPDVVDQYTIKQVNALKITSKEIEELCNLIEEKTHEITDTLYYNNCGYTNGELISQEILNGKLNNQELDKVNSLLSVNEKIIGINKFVSDFIEKTITGIVKTLNLEVYGVKNINKIDLLINNQHQNRVDNMNDYNNLKIKVKVNEINIEINDFVKKYLKNTLIGMISALNTDYNIKDIENAQIDISKIDPKDMRRTRIALQINETPIGINEFVCEILKESIYGMIKALKTKEFGVEEIENIEIKINK